MLGCAKSIPRRETDLLFILNQGFFANAHNDGLCIKYETTQTTLRNPRAIGRRITHEGIPSQIHCKRKKELES